MRDSSSGGALTEVTFYILLALYGRPRHGYAIMQFVERETGGRLLLGAGTLYGALNALEQKGWIAPCGAETGRRKEYAVTQAGRAAARRELARLQELAATAARWMEDGVDE